MMSLAFPLRRAAAGALLLGLIACDALDVLTHDITPPAVSISGIQNGATIIDPTTVSLTAHDSESKLARVEIFLDGSRISDATPGESSYAVNLTLLTGRENAGQHILEIRAEDEAGNTAETARTYTVFAP